MLVIKYIASDGAPCDHIPPSAERSEETITALLPNEVIVFTMDASEARHTHIRDRHDLKHVQITHDGEHISGMVPPDDTILARSSVLNKDLSESCFRVVHVLEVDTHETLTANNRAFQLFLWLKDVVFINIRILLIDLTYSVLHDV